MKIFILIPNLYIPGGVSALYSSLNLENIGTAKYFTLYFEKRESSIFDKFKRLILKYFEFNSSIKQYDIVILNPSLTLNSFFRDSVFALLVRIRKKKLIVFWHGWKDDVEQKIKNSISLSYLFRITFGRADGTVVLGSIFHKKLLDLSGAKKSKFLFFQNVAEFKLIEGRDARVVKRIGKEIKILFISRIEKNKGVLESIKIFQLIKSNLQNLNVYLTVAGEGSELENVKAYVYENKIKNVNFPGHVKGLEKHNLLINSHFLLFPSASEGLPLVILEGMAYGLPIISSPRGGIPDIIKESINGFLIEPHKIDEYVNIILSLVLDEELYSSISVNNYNYSRQHLTPEIARERLSTFCKRIYG